MHYYLRTSILRILNILKTLERANLGGADGDEIIYIDVQIDRAETNIELLKYKREQVIQQRLKSFVTGDFYKYLKRDSK